MESCNTMKMICIEHQKKYTFYNLTHNLSENSIDDIDAALSLIMLKKCHKRIKTVRFSEKIETIYFNDN